MLNFLIYANIHTYRLGADGAVSYPGGGGGHGGGQGGPGPAGRAILPSVTGAGSGPAGWRPGAGPGGGGAGVGGSAVADIDNMLYEMGGSLGTGPGPMGGPEGSGSGMGMGQPQFDIPTGMGANDSDFMSVFTSPSGGPAGWYPRPGAAAAAAAGRMGTRGPADDSRSGGPPGNSQGGQGQAGGQEREREEQIGLTTGQGKRERE